MATVTVNGQNTGGHGVTIVLDPGMATRDMIEAAERFVRVWAGRMPYTWRDGTGTVTVGASGRLAIDGPYEVLDGADYMAGRELAPADSAALLRAAANELKRWRPGLGSAPATLEETAGFLDREAGDEARAAYEAEQVAQWADTEAGDRHLADTGREPVVYAGVILTDTDGERGPGLVRYRTMTVGGSFGADIMAGSDEEAKTKAEAEPYLYRVLDITDYDGGPVLVIED